ncbi:MAG: ABC transporter permease [Anaerolineales bacterium]|jgi:lipopolysaccharide transport system permease protein
MAARENINSDDSWDLILRPKRSLLDLRLRELWRARDLVMLFVWRDFVSIYKQTILGPLWYIIQPLLTTIVFTFIFGSVAKLPTEGLPPFLFYMSGTVVWSYFSSCITNTSNTFINNSGVFGKVYFPRLAVPVSILISALIAFGIQFVFFLGFMGYFVLRGSVLHPNWWILLTPVLILIMAGLGLGLGIIISSLTTKYRDLRFLVTFGVTLLMYATPVILPLSSFPARFRWIVLANPMTPIVEIFRYAYLGGAGSVNLPDLAYSFGFMLVAVVIGTVIFNRVEATFMDTV